MAARFQWSFFANFLRPPTVAGCFWKERKRKRKTWNEWGIVSHKRMKLWIFFLFSIGCALAKLSSFGFFAVCSELLQFCHRITKQTIIACLASGKFLLCVVSQFNLILRLFFPPSATPAEIESDLQRKSGNLRKRKSCAEEDDTPERKGWHFPMGSLTDDKKLNRRWEQ